MNTHSDEGDQGGGRCAELASSFATPRLILRVPCRDDAAAIAEIANNRRIAEQTRRMPHPYSPGDAHGWMEALEASGECAFVITRKSDNKIIGAAGSGAMNEREWEVGYWIGESYWGQGYATEAVQGVIDRAFLNRPLEQLYGRCRVSNSASRRVLMKCGFQLVGAGMSDSRVLSGLVPVEEFLLERSVWTSLKKWGAA